MEKLENVFGTRSKFDPQIPVLFNIALPYFNEKFKRIEWNIDIFQVASQVFQNV